MYIYTLNDMPNLEGNFALNQYSITNSIEPHLHEFVEIVYICRGQGFHTINDIDYRVKRGDLLFINYGQTHSFHSENIMEIYNLMLKPEFISERLLDSENAFELLTLTAFDEFQASVCTGSPLVRFSPDEWPDIENLLDGLQREFGGHAAGYKTIIRCYITALLTIVFRKMAMFAETEPEKKNMLPTDLLEYIQVHCAEKLSLRDLAERSFYHPTYFSRLFKQYSGVTLSDYIHSNRIQKACELLKSTALSIDEVCAQTGYSDKTMFYKHFKAHTDLSPAEYRKSIVKFNTNK